jgi:hypothetical protein
MKEKETISSFLSTEEAVVDEVGGQRRREKKGTKENKRSMRSRGEARKRRDVVIVSRTQRVGEADVSL